MKRVRWLKTEFATSIDSIAVKLKAIPFNLNGLDGFIVDKIRSGQLEARYIEKLTHEEKVTDPFGNEEIFERVTYKETNFKLLSQFPEIELHNPPRVINTCINKLIEINNFSIVIEQITIDLLEWVELFQGKIENDLVMSSIQISGLELDKGIYAKVLIKGDKDVKKALENLVYDKKYKLDKVKLLVNSENSIFPVYLSANGTVNFSEIYFDQFLPLLRDSLASVKTTLAK